MSDTKLADGQYRLCYVSGAWAWFTTADVEAQWGDDWNDAPYQHNAGRPYEWYEDCKLPRYSLIRVAFDGPFESPEEGNRSVSVQDMNTGRIPWLSFSSYVKPPVAFQGRLSLMAGATLPEFKAWIVGLGGSVYENAALAAHDSQPQGERVRIAVAGDGKHWAAAGWHEGEDVDIMGAVLDTLGRYYGEGSAPLCFIEATLPPRQPVPTVEGRLAAALDRKETQ